MWSITGILTALALSNGVKGLSSWYTEPGGIPAGSTPGDKVRGVNVGGWFVVENWMMPDFFAVSPLDQHTILDEWSYCSVLGKEECLNRLKVHWDTYVTEDDFKRFSDYSLNTVRIPIGYWAWTDPEEWEPYVQGQLPYLEKALVWASNYGLDVMMDLHGLPGGQNGQDNQGYKGPIEFGYNSTNMERAMSALANMTAWCTADRFNGVVKSIQLTNEPYILEWNPAGMNFETLADFYVQGYQTVRANEHIAEGSKEVMVVIHDAFQPLLNWNYFWSEPSLGLNWTNYALDTHFYDAFGSSASKSKQEHLDTVCSLSANMKAAQLKFPVIVGEFSLGVNTYCVDYRSCFGLLLGDTIANLTDYEDSMWLRQFWEVQADVFELGAGWIFWSHQNQFGAPWSWSQSAAQNWIPEDPTEKIWPFDSNAATYCLDTWNPIAGDQNLPNFPGYANNISNIDITLVKPKNANAVQLSSSTAEAGANTIAPTSIAPRTSMSTSGVVPSATVAPAATGDAMGLSVGGGLWMISAISAGLIVYL